MVSRSSIGCNCCLSVLWIEIPPGVSGWLKPPKGGTPGGFPLFRSGDQLNRLLTVIGTESRNARELDRIPGDQAVTLGPVDPAPILGQWWNTNLSSWGISRAELVRRDGGIDVQIVAADPPGESRDWGAAAVQKVFTDGPGSGQVCGYTATFNLEHARTHLQANVNHGLTVIAAFTTFTDDSVRLSYLSREFYQRAVPAAAGRARVGMLTTPNGPAVVRGDDRLPMLRGKSIDPAPLLYRWRNADQTTRGVAEIRCGLRDGQLVVRVMAVGPEGPNDWGDAAGALHADISATGGARATVDPVTEGRPTPHYADITATDAGPAFWATYDHGFQRVHLQARINLGVLVVAMFTEFTDDSGRADYFHREVFIRDG